MEERQPIAQLFRTCLKKTKIVEALGRARSELTREVRRNWRYNQGLPQTFAQRDQTGEILERIYIDHRFRNDTEERQKLFEMQAKVTKYGAA